MEMDWFNLTLNDLYKMSEKDILAFTDFVNSYSVSVHRRMFRKVLTPIQELNMSNRVAMLVRMSADLIFIQRLKNAEKIVLLN